MNQLSLSHTHTHNNNNNNNSIILNSFSSLIFKELSHEILKFVDGFSFISVVVSLFISWSSVFTIGLNK